MAKVTPSLVELLTKFGGASRSQQLAKYYQDAEHISDAAARQRVSRLGKTSDISFISGLLPEGEFFYYLPSVAYVKQLFSDLKTTNSAYYIACQGICSRGGIVTKRELLICSGCPSGLDKHVYPDLLIENLKKNHILIDWDLGNFGKGYRLTDEVASILNVRVNQSQKRATLVTRDAFLESIHNWFAKLGFVSPGFCTKDAENSRLSTYWDYCGRSYLLPMRSGFDTDKNKFKGGYLLADIIINNRVTDLHVSYFKKKIDIIRKVHSQYKVLPFLIANNFQKKAFMYGRANGYVFTTPEHLFGSEVANALKGLFDVMTRVFTRFSGENDVLELDKIIKSLNRIEGSDNNLKGRLFEFLLATAISQSPYGVGFPAIEKIVTIPEQGVVTDIDIHSTCSSGKEHYFWECKGIRSCNSVSLEDVKKWITEQIPAINKWVKSQDQIPNTKTFILATSGDFTAEALEYLKNATDKSEKFTISWMNGKVVRDLIKKHGSSSIKRIYDDHFRNQPTI